MYFRLSGFVAACFLTVVAFAENVSVQNFKAQSSCNYFDSYIDVDYPIGDSGVVVPLREWLDSTLHCCGKIGEGENPIAQCFDKCNVKYAMLRDDFDNVEDVGPFGGYDSTWIIYASQTQSTVTYEVRTVGYSSGAAHEWGENSTYVLLKGRAKPLSYEDIFSVSRADMIGYLDYLAKVEPGNQRECGVRWNISEIDCVYPAADGIVFVWRTYEVNCGACGNVKFVIPYERFHGMFRSEFEKVMKEIKWRYWWGYDSRVLNPLYSLVKKRV